MGAQNSVLIRPLMDPILCGNNYVERYCPLICSLSEAIVLYVLVLYYHTTIVLSHKRPYSFPIQGIFTKFHMLLNNVIKHT